MIAWWTHRKSRARTARAVRNADQEKRDTPNPETPPRAQPQNTLWEFFKGNFVWLLGLVPVFLAGLRIWTVSQGDSEVFLFLLKNLNAVQLLLATIIPLTPVIVFWAWVAWVDWQRRTPREQQVQEIPDWVDIPIFIAMSSVMMYMPLYLLLTNIAILAFFAFMRRRWRKKAESKDSPYHGLSMTPIIWDARGIGLSLVATSILSSYVVWLPPEIIKTTKWQAETGSVISEDDRWTTILTRDRKIELIRTSNIVARRPCTTDWNFFGRPVMKVLSSKPPYEICPK